MRFRLTILAALFALVARGGVDFDAGADLRIRQELMDNVPGLPGGGLMLKAPRSGFANHVRFRPRVWGELKGETENWGKWRVYTRLTDEFRWCPEPYQNTHTFPDEVILDNLFVDNEGLPTSFLVCLSREIPEGRMTFKGNLSVRTKGLEPGKSDMASGDPKKVPDNRHTQKPGPDYTYTRAFEVRADGKVEKGCERIRVLDGTPENPIDLGFVNLPTCIFDLTGFYWEQQGWVNEEALREKRQKGYAMRPFEVGDLSLKPDARLLKEMPGFKPIPFGKIGLYRDKYRTDASLPARPEPDPMPDLQTAKSWWKLW